LRLHKRGKKPDMGASSTLSSEVAGAGKECITEKREERVKNKEKRQSYSQGVRPTKARERMEKGKRKEERQGRTRFERENQRRPSGELPIRCCTTLASGRGVWKQHGKNREKKHN